jgi:plasmid stability protein
LTKYVNSALFGMFNGGETMEDRKPYPSEAAPRFMVRLPDDMRERLKVAAKESNRTMNAEIVARLEASFREPAATGGEALAKRLAKIESRLDTLRECLAENGMGPLPKYWD